ncbi:MFS transporter [bacterium]|nr:MFS transporter [bacterium]
MEKIPLLLIFLGHVFIDASQGILPVVVTRQKDLFELSYFQVGLMMMVLNLTSSVIQPFFGFISDRVPTGWFIPVGLLWTATAMGLLGWAPNYLTALSLVALAGLGTAAFHPRSMMAVFLLSGSKKGLGTAVFSMGGNLGFAIGPMVGGFLVLGFGLHATLGLLPPCVLLVLLILFYPGDFLRRESEKPGPSDATPGTASIIPWVSLIAVCLIVTLRSWVYVSFITFLPLFFEGKGIALTSASLILTVFLACGAFAGLYGGHLSDRIGRKRIIVISSLVYPVFAALMLYLKGPWVWVMAGASGAALLASFSVTIVLTQELMPRHLGLASGLILGLSFGTGGLGTALSGFMADAYGLTLTFWILALVPILAAVLTVFITVPQRVVAVKATAS